MPGKALFERLCKEETLLAAWQLIKSKNAAGGLDGISVKEYNNDIGQHLLDIASQLRKGSWMPQPYLRIEIPKSKTERRKLGLLTIHDKIIQQAILTLISPQFDRLFVNNSYGYRPQKGPVKAVHRTAGLCRRKDIQWVLRLDIDNYFDTIDHAILFQRLQPYVHDEEVLRLIQLCVAMGNVSHRGHWAENTRGLPQGAILSPLLSNFYLHPFDQFVISRTDAYIRYADDFVVLCQTQEQALRLLDEITSFLDSRLHLKLNTPQLIEKTSPFEFLGIQLCNGTIALSDTKLTDLLQRINQFHLDSSGALASESLKSYTGIKNYYGRLLPQPLLAQLDKALTDKLLNLVETHHKAIPNKSFLSSWLSGLEYLSADYTLHRKQSIQEITQAYLQAKGNKTIQQGNEKNQRIIARRKIVYHRKEAAGAELVVNTPGAYVGMEGGNIVVRNKKQLLSKHPIASLQHLNILSRGVSLSSNAIDLCIENKVPIDFFDPKGKHKSSILSPKYMETAHWAAQANMDDEKRFLLAQKILYGKIKNQLNLVKYFNKYHAKTIATLSQCANDTIGRMMVYGAQIKAATPCHNYRESLMAIESQAAVAYWAYIRELLKDDGVEFEQREHQGATDLFNSMLNYGYALLYARVWQALLLAKLNPAESVLHAKQPGKPTLVYDIVELFRAQAVDRIVISMVQKHLPLTTEQGRLTESTRTQLSAHIIERFHRYEKYRGTETQFGQIIHKQALEIAAYISDNTTYRPYLSKW